MPQSLPASPRLYPSSTKASANIRLVASASLLRVATSRSDQADAVRSRHGTAQCTLILLDFLGSFDKFSTLPLTVLTRPPNRSPQGHGGVCNGIDLTRPR